MTFQPATVRLTAFSTPALSRSPRTDSSPTMKRCIGSPPSVFSFKSMIELADASALAAGGGVSARTGIGVHRTRARRCAVRVAALAVDVVVVEAALTPRHGIVDGRAVGLGTHPRA